MALAAGNHNLERWRRDILYGDNMKTIIAVTALIALSSAAHGYGYYNTTTNTVGNTTYTNTYGPNGYYNNITTNQVGNTIYSNGYDNKGNSVNCTTNRVGSYQYTNCY